MINAEMVENPVLEELDGTVPLLDEIAGREADRERRDAVQDSPSPAESKDSFEEIDFGSFFQDYLDPGYRSPEAESFDRPSFEHFLSTPTNLTDHLMWQLGSINCTPAVRAAAEVVIGNLNEDGYLAATDEELLGGASASFDHAMPGQSRENSEAVHSGVGDPEVLTTGVLQSGVLQSDDPGLQSDADFYFDSPDVNPVIPGIAASVGHYGVLPNHLGAVAVAEPLPDIFLPPLPATDLDPGKTPGIGLVNNGLAIHGSLSNGSLSNGSLSNGSANNGSAHATTPGAHAVAPIYTSADLNEALAIVRHLDPPGVACRDLRECLLVQLDHHRRLHANRTAKGQNGSSDEVLADAISIIGEHLRLLQNKQFREIAKAMNRPLESVMQAMDYVKTLDPKPGLRYNQVEPRLIEPDVAFVKQGDEYIVIFNDEDVPQLRLNTGYKKLLNRETSEKDVRNYVKERYKSAMQLIKNIEQRKQTIMKVCYSIVTRQFDFLEKGIDQLKPMMIKEVAEEIGVHPSTVSRAVANKYAHTAQGVFELRYFFSESVQGPDGGNTSLLILKRRVKKLIEEEDSSRPLTDEQITRILQSQGIQVTRRTVAKYREDMKIPSTHQRRVKA
jgi:RNA polymerase sigma-54 factor